MPVGAHPDLPRLPARRDGIERLQRAPGRGARGARPRGASAQPGPPSRRSIRSSTRSATGTRGRCACADCLGVDSGAPVRCTVYRPDIGGLLPVYVADRYEGIEARTFAECSDEEVAHYIDANVAAVAELLRARASRGRARQPPGDGAGDPRARARGRGALRGEDPRKRARVHGQARAGALSGGWPARGSRRSRDPRRLASHRGEPVAGARSGGRLVGANAPGPTRRRRRALRPPRSARRPRPVSVRWSSAFVALTRGDGARQRVRPRRAGRGAGARAAAARPRPAGGVRGQADREQGHRPADSGLAARARRGAAALASWWSASAPTGRGSSGSARRSPPARSSRRGRSPSRAGRSRDASA